MLMPVSSDEVADMKDVQCRECRCAMPPSEAFVHINDHVPSWSYYFCADCAPDAGWLLDSFLRSKQN